MQKKTINTKISPSKEERYLHEYIALNVKMVSLTLYLTLLESKIIR